MCFSASASFGSSGMLFALGSAAVLLNRSKEKRFFVAIPIGFAAQQLAEGVIWKTIATSHLSLPHSVAVGVFLMFALVIWPSWVPFSLLKFEKLERRKRALSMLLALGLFFSGISLWLIFNGAPIARIVQRSIEYSFSDLTADVHPNLYLAAYLIPTVLPMFVSSSALAKFCGFLILSGLVITLTIKAAALTSVWCFFAALISIVIALAQVSARLPWPAEESPSTGLPS